MSELIDRLRLKKEEITKKYENGMSAQKLADENDCSPYSIYVLFKSIDVHIRTRAEAAKLLAKQTDHDIPFIPTPEEIEEQKSILKKKHLDARKKKVTTYFPHAPFGNAATNMVSTANLGR